MCKCHHDKLAVLARTAAFPCGHVLVLYLYINKCIVVYEVNDEHYLRVQMKTYVTFHFSVVAASWAAADVVCVISPSSSCSSSLSFAVKLAVRCYCSHKDVIRGVMCSG